MFDPDILNPGLHLNVTICPTDSPITVFTLLATSPGFPQDMKEVESKEKYICRGGKPVHSQNKANLSIIRDMPVRDMPCARKKKLTLLGGSMV